MAARDPIDWRDACTLSDRVVYLVGRRETDSVEFQTYLRIFGREKIEQIWRQNKPKPKNDPRLPREPGED